MKKFKFLFFALALAPFFTGCSDDDDDINDLKLTTYTSELEVGEKDSIYVTSGNKGYKLLSNSDTDVVSIRFFGETGIELTGLDTGTSTVRITDNEDEVASISVTVRRTTQSLSNAAAFTLGHPGHSGFPESAMGLTYRINTGANTAEFTGNLRVISEDEYNNIETVEELIAYSSRTSNTSFTANADNNFIPVYLVVNDGDVMRLVMMTDLTFAESNNKAYFTERH